MSLTLQQLHELTGKVLKERPELANHVLVNDYDNEHNLAFILFQQDVLSKTLTMTEPNDLNYTIVEQIWQSN